MGNPNDAPTGLDLMMSFSTGDDWIRTSNREARRKTEYEKHLEKQVCELKSQLLRLKKLTKWQLFLKKAKGEL